MLIVLGGSKRSKRVESVGSELEVLDGCDDDEGKSPERPRRGRLI